MEQHCLQCGGPSVLSKCNDCTELDELAAEVRRGDRKAYLQLLLRYAKKTGDYSGVPWYLPADQERYRRVRELESVFAAEAADRNDGKSNPRWFITWNPGQMVDPVELWKRIIGYFSKNTPKSIKAWYAVIEQRSEEGDSPRGWHVHACVEFVEEVARSIVYQKLKATSNYFWSSEEQKKPEFKKNWLTVKPLQDYHRKYVSGEKREEKMAKVAADKIARGAYGFPEFLSGGQEIFPGEDIGHGAQEVSEVCSEAGSSSGALGQEQVRD